MASRTAIANRALMSLGDMVTTSIDDTASNAAIAMKAAWDTARDGALADHPWNFAIRRAMLANTGTAPAYSWLYAFTLPTDPFCLRVLTAGVTDPEDPSEPFRVEGREILCNVPGPLPVRYIARVVDPELYAPAFVEALALKLAVATGPMLGATAGRISELTAEYRAVLRDARSIDAAEGTPETFFADDFLTSRY